jgi:hypothetical protein
MLEPNDAREQLRAILNEEEYQVYYKNSKGWLETWWENAKEWIGEQLVKLLPSVEPAGAASVPILVTIIVIVLLLLALSAFLLIRNVKRNRLLRQQSILQSMMESNWSFQQHITEAKKQEDLEEYMLATRHLFLALLLYFHERKWLEARIWKTNWEYYDELRRIDQQAAEKFYSLASFFDEVTYGERTVSREEYHTFRQDVMLWLNQTGPANVPLTEMGVRDDE